MTFWGLGEPASSSIKADFDTTFTAAFWPVLTFVAKSTRPVEPLPKVLPKRQGPIFCGWLLAIDMVDDSEACLEWECIVREQNRMGSSTCREANERNVGLGKGATGVLLVDVVGRSR